MMSSNIRALLAGGCRQLAGVFGINLYQYATDRRVLEQTILPYFAQRAEFKRVLFVGCAWYTQHYQSIFSSREFITLDSDPKRRPYGACRHIEGNLEDIAQHFQAGELDVIFCNGILGWGLNDKLLIEKAFAGCVDSLRQGGVFVLGWNDVESRRPCLPEECESLRQMHPFVLPPLTTARHRTNSANAHTYDFYIKPTSR